MGIETAAAVGIIAVLTAVQFKSKGAEFGIYIIMAGGLVIFFYSTGKLRAILEAVRKLQDYIQIDSVYMTASSNESGHLYC